MELFVRQIAAQPVQHRPTCAVGVVREKSVTAKRGAESCLPGGGHFVFIGEHCRAMRMMMTVMPCCYTWGYHQHKPTVKWPDWSEIAAQ